MATSETAPGLLLLVEIPVLGDELPLAGRNPELIENCVHRADRLTVSAVDAGYGIDEVLVFTIGRVDAINRANFGTGRIFHANAGFGYNERHTVNLKALPALAKEMGIVIFPQRSITPACREL